MIELDTPMDEVRLLVPSTDGPDLRSLPYLNDLDDTTADLLSAFSAINRAS